MRYRIMLVFIACLLVVSCASSVVAQQANQYKFDFGSGPAADGWIRIDSDAAYDAQRGYGFDFDTTATFPDHNQQASELDDLAAGETPFYFSVAVPEGSYRVTILLGDPEHAANCSVKAECRQLMLDNVQTRPGETTTQSFSVNIRTPQLPDQGKVSLKDRELGLLKWDNKLTLEFNGSPAAVCSLEITPTEDVTNVFLLGDSTVTDQPNEPWNSWGQMLTRFFNDQVAISNHAASGESIQSSLGAGRMKKVFSMMRPGDFVFAQFGHNDMKQKWPNALEKYKADFEQLIDDVRKRGGIPVLVTSMERKAGVKQPTLGRYPETIRQVARDKGVALIDLNRMSVDLYKGMGDQLGRLFQDPTHHNSFGSYELARCMVEGIRESVPELARHLRTDNKPFDPKTPDDLTQWRIPPSPNTDMTKPEGS